MFEGLVGGALGVVGGWGGGGVGVGLGGGGVGGVLGVGGAVLGAGRGGLRGLGGILSHGWRGGQRRAGRVVQRNQGGDDLRRRQLAARIVRGQPGQPVPGRRPFQQRVPDDVVAAAMMQSELELFRLGEGLAQAGFLAGLQGGPGRVAGAEDAQISVQSAGVSAAVRAAGHGAEQVDHPLSPVRGIAEGAVLLAQAPGQHAEGRGGQRPGIAEAQLGGDGVGNGGERLLGAGEGHAQLPRRRVGQGQAVGPQPAGVNGRHGADDGVLGKYPFQNALVVLTDQPAELGQGVGPAGGDPGHGDVVAGQGAAPGIDAPEDFQHGGAVQLWVDFLHGQGAVPDAVEAAQPQQALVLLGGEVLAWGAALAPGGPGGPVVGEDGGYGEPAGAAFQFARLGVAENVAEGSKCRSVGGAAVASL